jgi:nicotinamidase-related amidase
MTTAELPLPTFYDPTRAAAWEHSPDQSALFQAANEWRRRHGIRAATSDTRRVHLLLIDAQKDFCFPKGSLYVGGRSGEGAIDDTRRTAEFIYKNLGGLTAITTTMDTHFAFQIFSPSFWVDAEERPLSAFTEITTAEIQAGKVKPNPAIAGWLAGGDYGWLRAETIHYCEELEKAGKYKLYLWPPHCLLGSDGHALVGLVHEARLFHSYARSAQSWVEVKGGNPLTENYSVLRPEVMTRHDGKPLGEPNTALIETLLSADAVVVAGQAASHCVKSSVEDLLDAIQARDPALARKVYLLTDCMSSVTVPDGKGGFLADFTPQAEEAQRRFAAAGMHLVKSTDPMSSWL